MKKYNMERRRLVFLRDHYDALVFIVQLVSEVGFLEYILNEQININLLYND